MSIINPLFMACHVRLFCYKDSFEIQESFRYYLDELYSPGYHVSIIFLESCEKKRTTVILYSPTGFLPPLYCLHLKAVMKDSWPSLFQLPARRAAVAVVRRILRARPASIFS